MDNSFPRSIPEKTCNSLYAYTSIPHTQVYIAPQKYGSISQQGLERLNDSITKDYFRSTNH